MKDKDIIKVKFKEDKIENKKIKQTRKNQVLEIEFDEIKYAKELVSKYDVFHLNLNLNGEGQSFAMLF